jgi:glycosyltransferase involved in cell wall biosynthesis
VEIETIPAITTIIPTFKRPKLLKKAVESVLSQTYPHFEIHVCDNHSADETSDIMREFVDKDSRVKYHQHEKNIGMMDNYQFGYSKVTTSYFSFLSDDDYYSPWFFESALESLNHFPQAAFSLFAVHAVNDRDEFVLDSLCLWDKKGVFTAPEGFLEMLTPSLKTPIPTCTLFNKKVLKETAPEWNQEIHHLWDHNFFLKIAAQFPYVVNEKVCGYFLAHDDGFSSGFFNKMHQAPNEVESYLQSAHQLIHNVTSNSYLPEKLKKIAKQRLESFFRNQLSYYLPKYTFRQVLATVFMMSKYLGFDKSYINHLLRKR